MEPSGGLLQLDVSLKFMFTSEIECSLVPVSVTRGLGEEALARDLVRNEAQHETEAEKDRG